MTEVDKKKFIEYTEIRNGKECKIYVKRNSIRDTKTKHEVGHNRTKIVRKGYKDQIEWEEFAKIISRRIGVPVTAGHSGEFGKFLDFEMITGIINRVYCDMWTEDGIIPARFIKQQFKENYVQYVFKMARDKFFRMLYQNGFVFREIDDEITDRYKKKLSNSKNVNYAQKDISDANEILRDYELKRSKEKPRLERKKERQDLMRIHIRRK